MTKKYFLVSLFVLFTISATSVNADNVTVQQIQSPIYTDDIGRSHFLGKGGYSSVRKIDMGGTYNDMVNSAVNDLSRKETEVKENIEQNIEKAQKEVQNVETDITKVIQEKTEVPVSNNAKATFSAEQSKMDATAPFGKGATFLPSSGVNESKTMYTDELGRLHFFGKANKFKD